MVRKPRIGLGTSIGKHTCISPECKIGNRVKIGDGVIMEGNIQVGDNTIIDHGVIIRGTTKIGKDNWIYPYAIIGTGPEHRAFADKVPSKLRIDIGDRNIIREYCRIHLPTESKKTSLGSDCYIMTNSHLAHDVTVHDHVTLSPLVILGGHTEVFEYANLGISAVIHQFCKIGSYTMVAMNSSITKDILPFSLINRQMFTKINTVGLSRAGVTENEIENIRKMYQNGVPRQPKTWYEKEVRRFMRISTRGTYEPSFDK